MLDTNAFDYIIYNELTNKVQSAVDNGKLQLFATDVQRQEIDAIPNSARKQAIEQITKVLRIEFLPTSGAVVIFSSDSEKFINLPTLFSYAVSTLPGDKAQILSSIYYNASLNFSPFP
jgi:hypothetical protein